MKVIITLVTLSKCLVWCCCWCKGWQLQNLTAGCRTGCNGIMVISWAFMSRKVQLCSRGSSCLALSSSHNPNWTFDLSKIKKRLDFKLFIYLIDLSLLCSLFTCRRLYIRICLTSYICNIENIAYSNSGLNMISFVFDCDLLIAVYLQISSKW